VYPGDLLCILVTPPAVCQDGACPRGGFHQGSAGRGRCAFLAGDIPGAMVGVGLAPAWPRPAPEAKAVGLRRICRLKPARRSYLDHRRQEHARGAVTNRFSETGRVGQARDRALASERLSLAAPDLELGGVLGSPRAMKVDASSRYSAARPPRPALKSGAHRRKSAEADWIGRRLAMRFTFDRRTATCSSPAFSDRGVREQHPVPLCPCLVASHGNATGRLMNVDDLLRSSLSPRRRPGLKSRATTWKSALADWRLGACRLMKVDELIGRFRRAGFSRHIRLSPMALASGGRGQLPARFLNFFQPASSPQPDDGFRVGRRPATTERGACGRAGELALLPVAAIPERGARHG
jgi:hypothetical protein